MNELKSNGHHLNPHLKNRFASIMEQAAKAFPPAGEEEQKLIARLRPDISVL
jgi:hypothetical protein